jgi:hypothetical protein
MASIQQASASETTRARVCDVSGRALDDDEEERASMLALRPVPSLPEEAKDFRDALRL